MDFSQEIIENIIDLIKSLLYLGNFNSQNQDTLTEVSKLLCVERISLQNAITVRIRNIGGENIRNELSEGDVLKQRDSLSRLLYGSLFNYIVKFFN